MEKKQLKYQTAWRRISDGPIIKAGGEFGKSITMNPKVVQKDNDLYLFYAADGDDDRRAIRLVVFKDGDFDNMINYGPVIEHGEWGSFDGAWCVIPNIVFFKGKWHMYYSGNQGFGEGLARFPGLGLATSDDLIHWEKYANNPVLTPSGIEGTPDAAGVAGGTTLMLPDGRLRWYYTGMPTVGGEHFVNQQKSLCVAESDDGINWEKKGAVISRIPERNYKDIATPSGFVIIEDGIFKIWQSCIGTRWGFYSICYAESEDGINWNVGECYGDELAFGPRSRHVDCDEKYQMWDVQNVSYPTVFKKDGKRYMFYCGNHYGMGGIGLAQACNSRVYARGTELFAMYNGEKYDVEINAKVNGVEVPKTNWSMPDADCNVWREVTVGNITVRLIMVHMLDGIRVICTAISDNEPAKVDVDVKFGNIASAKGFVEVDKNQTRLVKIDVNL